MSQFFEYTDSGIRFKGFQDLRKTLVEAWEATFGSGIDTSPTSPDGHHIDLEAATVNSLGEMLQAVATTFNRQQATGQYLDLLAVFIGIQRAEGESDASLRQRMDEADNTGLATYDGMLTYIRNYLGASTGLLVNDEPETDADGIPGHHFRVVVPEGVYEALEAKVEAGEIASADDYIAQVIWNCKAAGITGDGNMTGECKDKSGMTHTIRFSMPVSTNVEVKVTLSLYQEEAFPQDGEVAVQQAIIGWATGTNGWPAAEYTPGKDVIPERFYKPILTVPGISSAVIQVRKEGSSTWLSTSIPMSSQEIANLSSVSVEVEG